MLGIKRESVKITNLGIPDVDATIDYLKEQKHIKNINDQRVVIL